jgi:hypothetical protein
MQKKLLFFCFILVALVWPNSIYSQNKKKSTLELSGTITDKEKDKKNQFVKVTVYNASNLLIIDSARTSNTGEFKFIFDLGQEYLMTFEKKGYIKKKLLINTTFPNENGRIITNYFELFFQLSDKIPSNFGGELLDKPIAKVVYLPKLKLFDYDPVYTSSIKQELSRLTAEQIEKLTDKLESQAANELHPQNTASKIVKNTSITPSAPAQLPSNTSKTAPPALANKPSITPKSTLPEKATNSTPAIPPVVQKPTPPLEVGKTTAPVKTETKPVAVVTPTTSSPIPPVTQKMPPKPEAEKSTSIVKTETKPTAVVPIIKNQSLVSLKSKEKEQPPATLKTESYTKNEKVSIEKIKSELTNKKTMLEIVDRKKEIYELYLKQ